MRYWISEACFYLLTALAAVGTGVLLFIATTWPLPLIIALAMVFVYAIHYTGARATRGLF